MENTRKLMQFYFITDSETATHYHQNPEIFYVLRGKLEIRIDDKSYEMKQGDIILINDNKRHTVMGDENLLCARFEIDFHLLAEHMESLQLLFWCNTVVDKNDAYQDLRRILDRILMRYFEKDDKGAFYLNSLYYEALHILTSNFLIKTDDARLPAEDTQDRLRIRQIQNYIQSNYQSQISLNELADRLYLSNAYLSKYIKKHFGMTFMEYLNNVRLFHAVDELMYSNKNITHIALDNGFPTSASFTKAFRDVYHDAPSEYRKKIQENEQRKDQQEGPDPEDEKQILEYLRYREQEEEQKPAAESFCEGDAGIRIGTWSGCCRAVSIGDAYALLQSEVQSQVCKIKKYTGMRRARIWNILSRRYCFDEKEGYNFRKLDQVLDFLLENDLKPYIELGDKPSLFMYTPERSVRANEEKRNMFYKFDIYCEIIRELCLHLVNRYGVEELETWYFEYWNDPVLKMTEEDGAYYRFFDVLYQTLKQFSPEIKVGGAGLILGYETILCRDIFSIWKKREIQPDFLSVCSFQYIAIMEGERRYGRKSIDPDYMKNQVEIMKELMDETGFHVPEFHIDEWNFTISNRNVLNDSCEQGAYIVKNCIDMDGKVDMMAYWHALDLYSDYYDTSAVLNGDSGLISRDGIKKPSFYAFQFLNRLLPTVLAKNEHAVITTNGRDRYIIVCHNFKKLSSRYVFTEEDEIEVSEIEHYMDNIDSLQLTFSVDHVKNGNYLVKSYYVNKKNGSAQDLWKRLDYAKGLMKDEIEYLQNSAVPCMEMESVQIKDEKLELKTVLAEKEIRLLDIQYKYSR